MDDETKAAQMKSLTRILHASAQLDHVGYCQGMNYVAAFLLLEVKVPTSSQHVAENHAMAVAISHVSTRALFSYLLRLVDTG